jgi:hypothetical protein
MSKITFFLFIIFLIAIVILLNLKKMYQNNSPIVSNSPNHAVRTQTLESTLFLSPKTINTSSGKPTSVDVIIKDAHELPTLIQIEIAYDPNVLSDVHITSGNIFSHPIVLLNSVNENIGRISYAIKNAADERTMKESSVVATVTFTPQIGIYQKQTELHFLPKTTIKKYQSLYQIKEFGGTKINFSTRSIFTPIISTNPTMINK